MAVATKTKAELEAEIEALKNAATETVVPDDLNIFQRISLVSKEAGALAPKAGGGGVPFPFRGIDSTINHLAPFLTKYGIVVVPTTVVHQVDHLENGNRVVTWSEVVNQYTFYAPDGSNVVTTVPGIASDFADRSTAQAMSVALRIALLQTFTLPTQSPEPEVTGQAVLDGEGSAAPTQTRAQASIAKAKDPEIDPLDKARLDVRKAGAAKGLSPSQINEVGQKIDPEFFSKVDALVKVKEAIDKLEASE